MVDVREQLSSPDYAELVKWFDEVDAKDLQTIMDDPDAERLRAVFFGTQKEDKTTKVMGAQELVTNLEKSGLMPRGYAGVLQRVVGAQYPIERQIADLLTASGGSPDAVAQEKINQLHEELGALMMLQNWLKDVKEAYDDKRAESSPKTPAKAAKVEATVAKPLDLFEHEYVKELTASTLVLQTKMAVPTYDPRSELNLVASIQEGLKDLGEILDLAKTVDLLIQRKQVSTTVKEPALRLMESVYQRAKTLDDASFVTWSSAQNALPSISRVRNLVSKLVPGLSDARLAALAAGAEVQKGLLQAEQNAIAGVVNPAEAAARSLGLESEKLFSLQSRQIAFYAELIRSLDAVGTTHAERAHLLAQVDSIRQQLVIAGRQSVSVIAEQDSIAINFKDLLTDLKALKEKSGRTSEVKALELEINIVLFNKYKDAYLEEMLVLERSDKSPPALGAESNQVIGAIIFGRIADIIVTVSSIDRVKSDLLAQEFDALKADHGRRLDAAFMWVGGARDQLVYGSAARQGARGVSKEQNRADLPLTPGEAKDDMVDTRLNGQVGTNVVVGQRTVTIPKRWLPALDQRLVVSMSLSASDTVDVTYTESAVERVWSTLDELFEGNITTVGGRKVITVRGKNYAVPTDSEKVSIGPGKFHDEMNTFVDFIYDMEVQDQQSLGLPPRYTKELVARTIKSHVMVTWNHIALSSSSIIGKSCLNYYAANWLQYAYTEVFKEGVAKYNYMTTAFLFGYKDTDPWKLFKPKAREIVEHAVKKAAAKHGGNKYQYLLGPLIPIVDTSTTSGKPHFTVFSPPLRTAQLGRDSTGARLRHKNGAGLLMTMDDVREQNGRRIYGLMPLGEMDDSLAAIYSGFGQNAIDGILLGCLQKDVSHWDGETILNELKKNVKYTKRLFPKIGLEIEAAMADDPTSRAYEIFLNRFSVMLTLIKVLNMVMPTEVLRGQGKSLEAANDFLLSQQTANVITKDDREILGEIVKGIFRWDVFSKEIAEEFIKQVSALTLLGKH